MQLSSHPPLVFQAAPRSNCSVSVHLFVFNFLVVPVLSKELETNLVREVASLECLNIQNGKLHLSGNPECQPVLSASPSLSPFHSRENMCT